ncbi:unnamed protein product [Brassica oleracea]
MVCSFFKNFRQKLYVLLDSQWFVVSILLKQDPIVIITLGACFFH